MMISGNEKAIACFHWGTRRRAKVILLPPRVLPCTHKSVDLSPNPSGRRRGALNIAPQLYLRQAKALCDLLQLSLDELVD
ncbi:MAG: hypothetical protein KME25_18045 [Symplocastrum torsivum CPER-KK1]|uniref:Uncharacterized protein n=1 Tax=Symplocastrum torsivum CPER-KK1 TaxID=450513 RepID=A0A951PLW0_9CYAN|nr:hypothetical protein [Symplocastrum torsivum CPER-KK1]